MNTYRQLVYMVLDELKGSADDFTFTEDHVMFLLSKYRAFLLKQRYADIKKPMPESNYQTLCLELIEVPAIAGVPCEGGSYLRTKAKIPFTMKVGNPKVYPVDYFQGSNITFISRDRMRYVGYNKFMQNIIYCTLGPDNYLYLPSNNPQFIYMENIRFTAVFEDSETASELECNEDGKICDTIDRTFPIEEALVPPLIELVVKELRQAEYTPADEKNNANDDLDNVAMTANRQSR